MSSAADDSGGALPSVHWRRSESLSMVPCSVTTVEAQA